MQCPHCQGEIPLGSQFCGLCGRNIVSDNGHSPSLFDIPVSVGPKRIRIGIIVVLNVLLVGLGLAFFRQYLDKRDAVQTVVRDESKPTKNKAGEIGKQPLTPVADARATGLPSRPTRLTRPTREVPRGASSADAGTLLPGGDRPGNDSTKVTPSPELDAGSFLRTIDAGRPPLASTSRIDAGSNAPARTPEEEQRLIRVVASKISRVVAGNQGQLGRCYQNAQKITTPDNPIEGVIKIQFSIQNDGSAKSVRVSSNSTGSTNLGKCLTGLVRSWTFPSSQGDPLDFQWPFEFQAPK